MTFPSGAPLSFCAKIARFSGFSANQLPLLTQSKISSTLVGAGADVQTITARRALAILVR